MKFTKKILLIIILTMYLLIQMPNVYAASATISVKSSSKTVVVGNTFKVTVTVSSSKSLFGWQFDIKYDTSKLSLVSSTLEGNTSSVGWFDKEGNKTKTYTLTFKAKKAGSAKIYATNSLVYDFDDEQMTTTDGSTTVNIITQEELEASYSKDNYLKSLTVDGYELTPNFDKNTTEYSLELENKVREIKVSAKANDSKAEVDGTGKYTLSEGANKIAVSVTAENGNVRNYVINVIVKELNPINVTVNDKNYTVVRKAKEIEAPSTFSTTTTMINGEEVPAFESGITGYTLVALKDESGNIEFFIYEDGEYTLYEERAFTGITLYMIKPNESDIPEGYELTNMSISGVPTDAYKSEDSRYPLLYGVNVQTGETNWYSYDEEEITLQRYDSSNIKAIEVDDSKYLILIGALGGTCFILLMFLLLLNSKLRKSTIKKIA